MVCISRKIKINALKDTITHMATQPRDFEQCKAMLYVIAMKKQLKILDVHLVQTGGKETESRTKGKSSTIW